MRDVSSMLEQFQQYMDALDIPASPAGLYGPVRYALSLGGKRMRPLLLMLAYSIYRDDVENAFDAACGIEVFHNFTLLHDDVMDKADMRRGMPTVHRKWNENTAILSGDGMVLLAYRYLNRVSSENRERVLQIADKAFLEVVEGQQYDMDFERRADVTEDEYMEMIRLKTAVLPAAALEAGAVLGGATRHDQESLYRFGEKMGLAFQLQDDWLDVYGDPGVFGKKTGGDILCNKKTYLYIKARNLADCEMNAEMDRWAEYAGGDDQRKIDAVKGIYDRLEVECLCREKIVSLFGEAMECVKSLDADMKRLAVLTDYVSGLIDRKI